MANKELGIHHTYIKGDLDKGSIYKGKSGKLFKFYTKL